MNGSHGQLTRLAKPLAGSACWCAHHLEADRVERVARAGRGLCLAQRNTRRKPGYQDQRHAEQAGGVEPRQRPLENTTVTSLLEPRLRCCFCGVVPQSSQYLELTLRVEGSPARQGFGSHVECRASRLATGFAIEIEPVSEESSQDLTG